MGLAFLEPEAFLLRPLELECADDFFADAALDDFAEGFLRWLTVSEFSVAELNRHTTT